jgi:hypothetical protein
MPVAASPPDPQRGLKAGDPARGVGGEAVGGLAELERIRIVLGVINGHQIAAGPVEAVVQRAGLGAGRSRRHDDDPHPAGAVRPHRRRDRRLVVRLQQQEGLQPVQRIVDLRQAGDQLADHLGFVVQGGEDGVSRPAADGPIHDRRRGQGSPAEQDRRDPPDREAQKDDLCSEDKPARRVPSPNDDGPDSDNQSKSQNQRLKDTDAPPGRAFARGVAAVGPFWSAPRHLTSLTFGCSRINRVDSVGPRHWRPSANGAIQSARSWSFGIVRRIDLQPRQSRDRRPVRA